MPRTCTICRHDKAQEINTLIVQGAALRAIAGRYGTSKSSLERHRDSCVARQLIAAKELERSQTGPDLITRLREIHAETSAILTAAKKAKDWATALRAITRLEAQIELEAELLGELERGGGRGGETHVTVTYVDKQVVVTGQAQLPAPAEGTVYQKA